MYYEPLPQSVNQGQRKDRHEKIAKVEIRGLLIFILNIVFVCLSIALCAIALSQSPALQQVKPVIVRPSYDATSEATQEYVRQYLQAACIVPAQ